jgi:leucyl-tRNA synthetase
VTADVAGFRFNTAVAALMEYVNYLSEVEDAAIAASQWRDAISTFALLLAPICPFITEEVWQTVLGQAESVHCQSWPVFDPALVVEPTITLPVQVNGKMRDRIEVARDAAEAVVGETAVAAPGVQRAINGQSIRQIIIVPNRLVNIVVS